MSQNHYSADAGYAQYPGPTNFYRRIQILFIIKRCRFPDGYVVFCRGLPCHPEALYASRDTGRRLRVWPEAVYPDTLQMRLTCPVEPMAEAAFPGRGLVDTRERRFIRYPHRMHGRRTLPAWSQRMYDNSTHGSAAWLAPKRPPVPGHTTISRTDTPDACHERV